MLFELITLAIYSLFTQKTNIELISPVPPEPPTQNIKTASSATPQATTSILGAASQESTTAAEPASPQPTNTPVPRIPTPTPVMTQEPSLSPTTKPTATATPSQSPKPKATSSPSDQAIATSTATIKSISSPTATPSEKPITYSITGPELDALFTKYSEQYKIEREQLRKIALCESKFNTNALNKKYGYGGLYQFSSTSWKGYRKLMGQDSDPNLRFNPEEAVETAAWMLSTGRSSAWPSCR